MSSVIIITVYWDTHSNSDLYVKRGDIVGLVEDEAPEGYLKVRVYSNAAMCT